MLTLDLVVRWLVQLWKFIEDWKKVFDHFDADHSRMIDRKELADVLLAKFGWTLSPALLDQTQSSKTATLHRNSKTGVTLDTFLRAVVIVQQLSGEFGMLDTDHDNLLRIGYEQLVQIVLRLLFKLG
ncbi:hypothetical protein B0H13DRAFT_1598229 [Mycena leptocephala]|nr:hypothetical protein B0H13DRAFT_1598229 [Mycena leptocephala]